MTTTDASAGLGPNAFVARRAAHALFAFLRAWKNRREIYRLGEMSDAALSDIGLTRSDLNVVVALPLSDDPTVHLGALADARRRHRLAGRV